MSIHKITHVAIVWHDRTYTLPSPNRHHHVIEQINKETGLSLDGTEIQGFLDDRGKFLNRKNALATALKAGQVKCPDSIRAGRLFSEDVW
jgi:hypothetical protein